MRNERKRTTYRDLRFVICDLRFAICDDCSHILKHLQLYLRMWFEGVPANYFIKLIRWVVVVPKVYLSYNIAIRKFRQLSLQAIDGLVITFDFALGPLNCNFINTFTI